MAKEDYRLCTDCQNSVGRDDLMLIAGSCVCRECYPKHQAAVEAQRARLRAGNNNSVVMRIAHNRLDTQSPCSINPLTYENIHRTVTSLLEERSWSLPLTAKNEDGNAVIISAGKDGAGHFYRLDTLQDNDWIRVNCYYADGIITETYER